SKEATGEKQFDSKKNSKNDFEESICSGHFKKSEVPKSGGSILPLIDDLVKVWKTIGYDMKGCMKNIASVGNLGRILCVWDPNMFKKMNSTVSDYFVMVRGEGDNNVVNKRTEVVNLLQEVEKKNSLEAAQKAKIKSTIEGDENSKYYHGEIKKAVWDCGIDKSPGPDGFTFSFYRRYWKLIENDVVDVVTCFFHQDSFPKGGNSSFIILIPKTPNANMVKDYMPISLIGSMYNII
nr:RNA-directed DNA polymerase, eukaryota, reverse transcriptase zinc-binding domain protein [Tanacetum cinerariifolium]